jgi:hypothetical protein
MASIKVDDIKQLMEDGLHFDLSEEKKMVLRAIDIAHKDMAEIRDWRKLRMKKALSFTGSDVALPTNLIGITGIQSSTEIYLKCEEEDALMVDGRPHWYYASQTGTNPSATQYINILDATGAADTASVTVFYWAYPETLTGDNDDIMVPGPRALAMLSIVILLGFIDHKPGEAEPFRAEYNNALSELLARYPVNARAKLPKGRHGRALALGDIG